MTAKSCAIAGLLLLAGCIDRTRVNDSCTWSDPVSGALDLGTRAGREHLRADAEIANDLMVRFGDAHVHHRPDLQRPFRDQCIRAMTDSVVARHGITRAQFVAAERDRVWWADILFVLLPMAALAATGTAFITRRVCRSFDPEDRVVAGAAVGVLALLVTGLALGVANFWSFAVEGWRLNNGHVSNRAFLIPIVTHPWVCTAIAAAVCISTAVVTLRRTPLSATSQAVRYGSGVRWSRAERQKAGITGQRRM